MRRQLLGGVLALATLLPARLVYGQLGLLKPGSPLPRVDDGPLREALASGRR